MIEIKRALKEHVQGIADVCGAGYRNTYAQTHDQEYIERIIQEFYNLERLESELEPSNSWSGWHVAVDGERVVGATCGGFISEEEAELFALYLAPGRKREGIGTMLLDALTEEQKKVGARIQWVSAAENNEMGIPFYLAKGFKEQGRIQSYANKDNEEYRSIRYRRNV